MALERLRPGWRRLWSSIEAWMRVRERGPGLRAAAGEFEELGGSHLVPGDRRGCAEGAGTLGSERMSTGAGAQRPQVEPVSSLAV